MNANALSAINALLLSSLLTLVSAWAGTISIFIAPALLIALNLNASLISLFLVMLTSLAITYFSKTHLALPVSFFYAVELWIVTTFLSIAIKHKFTGILTLILGTVILSATLYLSVKDLDKVLIKGIDAQITEMEKVLSTHDKGLKEEDKVAIRNFWKKVFELVKRYVYAITIIGIVFILFINMLFSKFLTAKRGLSLFPPEFRAWKLPEELVWVLIVAMFLILISKDPTRLYAENLALVMASFYFIQGLSVINHIFYVYDFPTWFKFIIYLILFLQWYGFLILFLIGLSDIWVEWRNRLKPRLNHINHKFG